MSMYEAWRISRWHTPVVDVDQLVMVSFADVDGELVLVLESFKAPNRPRWRVRFKRYPAYRNIDEAYRTDLWQWLDESDQRFGFTFTVEESPQLASWGTIKGTDHSIPRIHNLEKPFLIRGSSGLSP